MVHAMDICLTNGYHEKSGLSLFANLKWLMYGVALTLKFVNL